MAFFADTYMTKVNGFYNKALRAASAQEAEGFVADLVAAVKAEVEPLLAGAKPYFGGAESLTMAEVRRPRAGSRDTLMRFEAEGGIWCD